MLGSTRGLLLAVLIAVAFVNVYQFRSIDDAANSRYRALERSDTSQIIEIGMGSPSLMRAYGFHVAMAEVAPHSQLLVYESRGISLVSFRELALGFGQAVSVQAIEPGSPAANLTSVERVIEPRTGEIAAIGVGTFRGSAAIDWQIVTQDCERPRAHRTMLVAVGLVAGQEQLSATEVCTAPGAAG